MRQFTYHRIKAVVIRNLLRYKHNTMTLLELIFWPLLDIVVWGTTSVWFVSTTKQSQNLSLAMLTGLVFWELTVRSIQEISVGLLNEIHEKSLFTIFTTPLTIAEWIMGGMITGLFRALFSVCICSIFIFFLYSINVFSIGLMFIPFFFSLLVFGLSIGLFGAGFVILYGNNVHALPWMLAWVFMPFSAVFYPLSILPYWMRCISSCLPTTYIFECMRSILLTDVMPWHYFIISIPLNVIYLTTALFFFAFMFKKSKEKGLARL
jgi:ABC-2 type transport system permease protein